MIAPNPYFTDNQVFFQYPLEEWDRLEIVWAGARYVRTFRCETIPLSRLLVAFVRAGIDFRRLNKKAGKRIPITHYFTTLEKLAASDEAFRCGQYVGILNILLYPHLFENSTLDQVLGTCPHCRWLEVEECCCNIGLFLLLYFRQPECQSLQRDDQCWEETLLEMRDGYPHSHTNAY